MSKGAKTALDGRQQAVIFDFDGTIADSLLAVVEVFEDLTKRHERFSPEEIERMRELSVPELMKVLGVPRWKAPILLIRGRKMLRRHLSDIALHDGMADVLRALHKDGVPLYVLSSNSTENVRKYLRQHQLLDYFAAVYGGASLLGKAPRLYKLVDEQQIDVATTWYVGDETRDVSAARSVGFKAASVTWGFNTRAALIKKQPDTVADTPLELLRELRRTWKK